MLTSTSSNWSGRDKSSSCAAALANVVDAPPALHRRRATFVEALGSGSSHGDRSLAVSFDEGERLLPAAYMSDGFFRTLGVSLAIGRAPSSGSREAAISHDLWRTRFGGDPGVVGRPLRADGELYTVVGVVPRGLRFPGASVAVWVPVEGDAAYDDRRSRGYAAVGRLGRLAAGTTLEQAGADVDRVSAALSADYPDTNAGVSAALTPLIERLTEPVRGVLILISAAAALVLLAGAASFANLVLFRNAARAVEAATRAALGATPRRRAAEHAAEHVPVALGGAVLGWLIWRWTAPGAASVLPAGLAPAEYTVAGKSVLVFALASAGAVAAGAALLSALPALGVPGGMPGMPDARTGRRIRRLTRTSSVVQVALSVVLVYAAVVLYEGLEALRRTDIGISNRRVLSTFVDLRGNRGLSAPGQSAFLQRMVDRVAAAPGVRAAAASLGVPPDQVLTTFYFRRPDPLTGAEETHVLNLVPVTPGYFGVLGIPLLEGRVFDARDDAESEPLVVLSAGAARRFFGEERAAGHMLEGSLRRVAGVVGDVRYRGLTEPPADTLYFPTAQFPVPGAYILADGVGDFLPGAAAVARMIREVDPGIPVGETVVVGEPTGDAVGVPTVRTWTVALLAAFALAQTVVALYGAAAYAASRRRPEYALRRAVGATGLGIALAVLAETGRYTAAGLALGVGAAALIGRALGPVLDGFGGAAGGVAGVRARVRGGGGRVGGGGLGAGVAGGLGGSGGGAARGMSRALRRGGAPDEAPARSQQIPAYRTHRQRRLHRRAGPSRPPPITTVPSIGLVLVTAGGTNNYPLPAVERQPALWREVEPDPLEVVVLRGTVTALGGLPKSSPGGGRREDTNWSRQCLSGPRRDATATPTSRGTDDQPVDLSIGSDTAPGGRRGPPAARSQTSL